MLSFKKFVEKIILIVFIGEKTKKGCLMPKNEELQHAIEKERSNFEKYYVWLEKHMPPKFFEEAGKENILLVTHSLMSLHLQNNFSEINLKNQAIIICLDSPDADLRILSRVKMHGIKNYRAFVSDEPLPFSATKEHLRIATIFFTHYVEKKEDLAKALPKDLEKEVFSEIKKRNDAISEEEFHGLLEKMNPRFLRSLTKERLLIALDLFFQAKKETPCKIEVKYNKDWKEKGTPSIQIVLAWKNCPKYNFLTQIAKTIYRHHLVMKKVNAAYIDLEKSQNVLLMSLGLEGIKGKAAWEEADIEDFLQELVTIKYFEGNENIETLFVDSGLVRGNLGNLLKSIPSFIHQALLHEDPHMYSFNHIEEALLRHPELTVKICKAFEEKFHPEKANSKNYEGTKKEYLSLVEQLDTGHEANDKRRKNILKQAINFVDFTLKTNFYRKNKTAFCFRLDPQYLEHLPYERKEKFPELPYAIFYMKGRRFIGFHIRFKDLSRGGLRTVMPERMEQYLNERNNIFAECYGLSYTQQKKNKDIPEGGAKGIILIEPHETLLFEEKIYQEEQVNPEDLSEKIQEFRKNQKLSALYESQCSYIESFLSLINCNDDGSLKAKHIVDYYKKPEYIYLGPDENMHNSMIEWIAEYSKYYGYKPGASFISSKPGAGINHKEYGVTSLGVNVYMEETLKYLGIDPYKQSFTIKISGGPDGDVAGNQILNLFKYYPKTAKLLALTDVSGTIYDPNGLDLKIMADLFHEAKSIRFYPPEKLSEGGFLLDLRTKKEQTAYAQQTLCYRKKEGKLIEDWLSGNEMNHLFRSNVHQTKTDIFIPGGGRPRTLNDTNYKDYLDPTGNPTSKAIVEGANLYLTPWARRSLEKLGVLIIKDSSANKGGVICSSFEVLCGLVLSEEEFIQNKPVLMKEILEIIKGRAKDEANLLLSTHKKTGAFLTDISEWVSERINSYMYELLDYFGAQTLSNSPEDPLNKCLLNYCPAFIAKNYPDRVLKQIPDIHKKAIISCYIASRLVYSKGLDWAPTLSDILPLIANDPHIMNR